MRTILSTVNDTRMYWIDYSKVCHQLRNCFALPELIGIFQQAHAADCNCAMRHWTGLVSKIRGLVWVVFVRMVLILTMAVQALTRLQKERLSPASDSVRWATRNYIAELKIRFLRISSLIYGNLHDLLSQMNIYQTHAEGERLYGVKGNGELVSWTSVGSR